MSHLNNAVNANCPARPRERGLKPERGPGSAVVAEPSGAALIEAEFGSGGTCVTARVSAPSAD